MIKLPDVILDIIYNEFISPKTIFREEVLLDLLSIFSSGFQKPRFITKRIRELESECKAIRGWKLLIFLARYIRPNDLVDPEDEREINPDEKLNWLFDNTKPFYSRNRYALKINF